jgi:hypothetical protein
MKTANEWRAKVKADTEPDPPTYPPLAEVTSEVLHTEEVAHYLRVRPQTLRFWSCYESGPLMPVRGVGRHLLWRTEDVRRLLGMTVEEQRKLRPKAWTRKMSAPAV